MKPPACPNCIGGKGRHLAVSSDHATVDYFRCIQCGHVWCFLKEDKLRIPINVSTTMTRRD